MNEQRTSEDQIIWDSSSVAVLIDLDSARFIDASAKAVEVLGYSVAQLQHLRADDGAIAVEPTEVARLLSKIRDHPLTTIATAALQFRTADGRVSTHDVLVVPSGSRSRNVALLVLIDAAARFQAESRYATIFDAFPLPLWLYDAESLQFIDVNDCAVLEYGYSRDEFLSMRFSDLLVTQLSLQAQYKGVVPQHGHRRFRKKDGTIVDVETSSDFINIGTRPARIIVARNITEIVVNDRAAELARQRLEQAQEMAHLGYATYNLSTFQVERSSEVLRIAGYSAQRAAERDERFMEVVHPDDRDRLQTAIDEAAIGADIIEEVRVVRSDDSQRWINLKGRISIDHGERILTVALLDITERKEAELQLRYLAYHDQLTGLRNRQALTGAIEQMMRVGRGAIFYVDFDGFSEVNDSFGHRYGDVILQLIAKRLRKAAGLEAEAFRWGGDEFAIVQPLRTVDSSYQSLLQQLQAALEPSYEYGERELFITPSIGVSLYPTHGETPEDLLRNADVAMYEAKAHKNTSRTFDKGMHDGARRRMQIQNGLYQALRSKLFKLVYQPVFSAADGRLISAEALLRWDDPVDGIHYPGEFIDIAERSGLIVPIGDWVIDEVCDAIANASGEWRVPISINVSIRQMEAGHLVDSIQRGLKGSIDPSRLSVEITETSIMRDVDLAVDTLRKLRAMGMRIALDDFGTGYSSLSYLKTFALDSLKIDRSFVADLNNSERDRDMITAIVHLCRATQLQVIAEGVETERQYIHLKALQCDGFQGNYFSEPLSKEDFVSFLQAVP